MCIVFSHSQLFKSMFRSLVIIDLITTEALHVLCLESHKFSLSRVKSDLISNNYALT